MKTDIIRLPCVEMRIMRIWRSLSLSNVICKNSTTRWPKRKTRVQFMRRRQGLAMVAKFDEMEPPERSVEASGGDAAEASQEVLIVLWRLLAV